MLQKSRMNSFIVASVLILGNFVRLSSQNKCSDATDIQDLKVLVYGDCKEDPKCKSKCVYSKMYHWPKDNLNEFVMFHPSVLGTEMQPDEVVEKFYGGLKTCFKKHTLKKSDACPSYAQGLQCVRELQKKICQW